MSVVWGIDPSTKAIALAVYDHPRIIATSTRAIHQAATPQLRLAGAVVDIGEWLRKTAGIYGAPERVVLEQPFAAQASRVHPQSHYMVAAVQIALVTVSRTIDVRMLTPGQWKKLAWGNGAMRKPALMAAALEVCPYVGSQDEADAVGMALAAWSCV